MEQRIKKIIEFEDLNVNQFSKIIGVSRSTLSHILSGRNRPSVDVLEKILDKFSHINANWLLRGLESMNSDSLTSKENAQKIVEKIVVFYSDNSFQEFKP